MSLVDLSGDWEIDMLPDWRSDPGVVFWAIALRKSSWLTSWRSIHLLVHPVSAIGMVTTCVMAPLIWQGSCG